jgi:hypothetical protein
MYFILNTKYTSSLKFVKYVAMIIGVSVGYD